MRIGADGVVVRDNAILLSHWNSAAGSGWSLPGGGVEDFELVPDAVIREIDTVELVDIAITLWRESI